MPKPNSGESRNDFVKRCVPIVMSEGTDQDAAVGKCEGIYNSVRKSLITKALSELVKVFRGS
jgi:hypothetical protein